MSRRSTKQRAAAKRQPQQPVEILFLRHPASGRPVLGRWDGGTGDAELDALFPAIGGTFGGPFAPGRPTGPKG